MSELVQKNKKSIIMFFVTVVLLIAGIVFQSYVSAVLEENMENNLIQLTAQIKNTTEQKLSYHFKILHTASHYLQNNQETDKKKIAQFMEFNKEESNFLFFGAVSLQGKGIFGPDIPNENLILFQNSFRGKNNIQWLENSPLGEKNSIWITVPLYNKEHIVGSVYAVYNEMDILGLTSNEMFDGQVQSFIINQGFQTTIPSVQKNESNDLQSLNQGHLENRKALENLKIKLYQNHEGIEKFIINGEEMYVSCVPLDTMSDWYAVCMIPAQVLTEQTQKMVLFMSLVVMGLCFLLLAAMWLFDHIQEKNQKKIYELAYIDKLTQISNWEKFRIDAEKLLIQNDIEYVLALLDIDAFHLANNVLGKNTCDHLLKQFAEFFTSKLLDNELVCRIEGDRFALLLQNNREVNVSERLMTFMNEVVGFLYGYRMTFSCGVVLLAENNMTISHALECCILAEKMNKNQNKNSILFYNEDMKLKRKKDRILESSLSSGLLENEFVVYLQPMMKIHENCVSGAEALIRWQHPMYGFLYPSEFMPLFESDGRVGLIDFYMLREVCVILKEWQRKGIPNHVISLNISRGQTGNPNLAEELWQITQRFNISPCYINLELSENFLFDKESCMIQTIHELKEKGFLISIDDFGAGYFCLGELPGLPVHTVKLHESLMDICNKKDNAEKLITDTVGLIHHLGMTVLAEGVENTRQLSILMSAGCEMAQGNYFSRPMPVSAYETYLKDMSREGRLVKYE